MTLLLQILLGLFLTASVIAQPTNQWEELRIYEVLPGKMEGTLERFRDHVSGLFVKHGLTPVAFWTGKEGEKEIFAYILRSPSEAQFKESSKNFSTDPAFQKAYQESVLKHGNTVAHMESYTLKKVSWHSSVVQGDVPKAVAVELRLYQIEPEKSEIYLESYRESRCAIFKKHGLDNLGYWISRNKDGYELLVMLLGHETIEAISKAKDAYHKDPDWAALMKRLGPHGKLTTSVRSLLLTPTSFSRK